jgi:hypothetical protein
MFPAKWISDYSIAHRDLRPVSREKSGAKKARISSCSADVRRPISTHLCAFRPGSESVGRNTFLERMALVGKVMWAGREQGECD